MSKLMTAAFTPLRTSQCVHVFFYCLHFRTRIHSRRRTIRLVAM